jgi:hypothetical protein
MPGSLEVKSVGTVTERLLIQIPSRLYEKSAEVPLSISLNPNRTFKSLWIRVSAKCVNVTMNILKTKQRKSERTGMLFRCQ